jgi:hypothetical protein
MTWCLINEAQGQLFYFTRGERAPGTHWIGGWVGPRAGLDDVEKTKIALPYRKSNHGRPARSLLLYRLSYRVRKISQKSISVLFAKIRLIIFLWAFYTRMQLSKILQSTEF